MQNEFQPEQNQTPLAAKPAALLATETKPEAQAQQAFAARLDTFTQRAKTVKRQHKISSAVINVSVCSSFVIIPLLFGQKSAYRFPLSVFCLCAGPVTSGLLYWYWSQKAPKFDAEEMARPGGVRAVVPLFAILQHGLYAGEEQPVLAALTVLLPKMKASDTNLLTPYARRTMHSWLSSALEYPTLRDDDSARCIATLKALEQIGDSTSIPVVNRLAEKWPLPHNKARLQQAAIECLPMLRANCGEVEAARTLLRASHAEAARPDTLLRPASGAGQTTAQELLRPSDEESS